MMVGATVRQIVDEALTIIGEVAGSGVETYEDDRMMREAIRGFNLLFKKYDWHQYQAWFSLTLDGVNGIVTTDDLEDVKDFEDFISVNPDKSDHHLPVLSRSKNPFTFTGNGSQPLYWTSLPATSQYYTKRKLQFWPKTATSVINVHAKVYPITDDTDGDTGGWDWDSRMELDKDMLAYGAAFMTLASDDLNSNAATIVKGLMEMRYRDILAKLGSHPLAGGSDTGIPTDWREYTR